MINGSYTTNRRGTALCEDVNARNGTATTGSTDARRNLETSSKLKMLERGPRPLNVQRLQVLHQHSLPLSQTHTKVATKENRKAKVSSRAKARADTMEESTRNPHAMVMGLLP